MSLLLGYGALGAVLAFICALNVPLGWRIGLSVLMAVVAGFAGYFLMPTLAYGFSGLLWLVFALTLVATCLGYILTAGDTSAKRAFIGPAFCVAALALPWATSWSAFYAGDYQRLVLNGGSDMPSSDFNADVSPVDINHVRAVNQQLANKVGKKRIGEVPGLGSRAELGTMNIQQVSGTFMVRDEAGVETTLTFDHELVWAGPINPSDIRREWHTPGYILVSAEDDSKVWFVREVKNPQTGQFENVDLYFLKEGYWGANLERHLRNNGYMSRGLTDYSFEIRDDGRPFWVVTLIEKKVGFGGADAVGVVVVDPQTGDINEYGVDAAPAWIDRIQPHTIIENQLTDWGLYQEGWWNAVWSKQGKIVKPTKGISLVYGADGQSYWYTGISSFGSDDSTTGFVLVNTRTKRARWYQVAGTTEVAAMGAAQDDEDVLDKKYLATFPILYNVGGVPSYYMTLKGPNGLVQAHAWVSVEDITVVGVGSTQRAALRDYQAAMSRRGSGNGLANDLVEKVSATFVVTGVTLEGEYYYLLVEGRDGVEFSAGTGLSRELKWTRPGDEVTLTFNQPKDPANPVRELQLTDFDLLRLNLEN